MMASESSTWEGKYQKSWVIWGHLGLNGQNVSKRKNDLLVKGLNLNPSDTVADIGAGSGYFSFRMASWFLKAKFLP